MLRAGLGWGSMPRHMVAEDMETGRLIQLRLDRWAGTGRLPRLEIIVARLPEQALGPAAQWLFDALAADG